MKAEAGAARGPVALLEVDYHITIHLSNERGWFEGRGQDFLEPQEGADLSSDLVAEEEAHALSPTLRKVYEEEHAEKAELKLATMQAVEVKSLSRRKRRRPIISSSFH